MRDSDFTAEDAEEQRAAEGRKEMHENEISKLIIGGAIEVHRELGLG